MYTVYHVNYAALDVQFNYYVLYSNGKLSFHRLVGY